MTRWTRPLLATATLTFAWALFGCQSPQTVDMPGETGAPDGGVDAFDATLDDTKDATKDSADAADSTMETASDADDSALDGDESGDSADSGGDETGDAASDAEVAMADAAETDPPWDGMISCDAGDTGTDAPTGTRFCELYVDLFSPTGVAKCQSSLCHGGKVGVVGLAMGWTGKECYDAITTHSVSWLPPYRVVKPIPGGDSRPVSLLPIITDPASDAGLLMPWIKTDNRLLNDTERARINAWLARGAPFD